LRDFSKNIDFGKSSIIPLKKIELTPLSPSSRFAPVIKEGNNLLEILGILAKVPTVAVALELLQKSILSVFYLRSSAFICGFK